MSIDQRARSNNQKLFDVYAKKLCSDDVSTFYEVAEKLTLWLDNGKAYYDEARPEIVKLLMIAQSTVRRAVGIIDTANSFHVSQYMTHPFVSPYIKLVRVVRQFIHHFVEQELEVKVRYLVSTVSGPLPPPTSGVQNLHTTPKQASPLPSGFTAPQSSNSIIPNDSGISIPRSGSISSPANTAMDSTRASEKVTVQKVKRKRKTLDHLIDVDLRKFRENASLPQESSTPSVTRDPAGVLANEGVLLGDAKTPEITLPPNLSRKSKRPTAMATASAENIQQLQGIAKEPTLEAGDTNYQKRVDLVGEVGGPTFTPPATAMHAESSSKTAVLSEHVGGAENRMSGVDEVKGEKDTDILAEDAGREPVSEQMYSEIGKEDYCNTPTRTTVLDMIQELHSKLSLCASQALLVAGNGGVEPFKTIIDEANDVDPMDYKIRDLLSPDDRSAPRLDVKGTNGTRPKCSHAETLDSLILSANGATTMIHCSLDRIKIPAFVRGLTRPGRVRINFNIKPAVHLALSRWTQRSCHNASNVHDAICVTLGCYKATETTLSTIAHKSEPIWKEFVSSNRSSWPQTGGLQLVFTVGQQRSIPLSPPLSVTPDGLLDITTLLVAGANGFEIRLNRDMSKYVFALVVHPPTRAQLSLHSERCKKEQDWQDWIYSLSQPFDAHLLAQP